MALVNVQFQIDDSQLIAGPQGPQGEQGPVGPQGDPGPQGVQGPAGSGGMGVSIMDFGGTLSGDNTPALNAALSHCASNNKRVITFPEGFFGFSSQPNPINGIRLIGQGKTATYLVRNYSGNFLKFAGGTLGGGGCDHIGLLAGAGTSGGFGLHLVATQTETPDLATFNNVLMSSNGGTFGYPLLIDGSLRTSPQGVRNIRFNNCDFFAGTLGAAQIFNGVAIYMDGCGFYPAGGTSGDLIVQGGSTVICINNANVQGILNLSNCSKVTFNGHVIGFSGLSSASQCFVTGTKGGGAISNALTNSHVNLA